MPRLTDPAKGTVVRCEGDLAAHYVSLGWADADAKAKQVKAAPEKPKATRKRT